MLTGLILLIVGILLFYVACRALAQDVMKSYTASMGAEMSFSTTWMLGSFLGLTGVMLIGQFTWWCFIPGVIFLYFLSAPVRIYIKERYTGQNMHDEKIEKGFSSFSQSISENKQEED